MFRFRRWLKRGAWGCFALLMAACGGDDESVVKTTTNPPPPPPPPDPPTVIDIAVDSNRDGVVNADDSAAAVKENEWGKDVGASFLANVDDDDADGVADADDEKVNGPEDEKDLALIQIQPWPDAPDGAAGKFGLDAISAEHVRIWKKGADAQYTPAAGSVGACADKNTPCDYVTELKLSAEEVRAGLTLAIEGRHFRISADPAAWNGMVELSYSVLDQDGAVIASDENADGIDRAKMRVAPWMMFGNLSVFDTAYSDSYDANFTMQLALPLAKADVKYLKTGTYYDQWVQDWFQTAWTSVPGPDGTVQGMRVYNPRPWSQQGVELPIGWLMDNKFGPDRAVIQIYKEPNTGDTYDSHGNHDLLPPYTNGSESFPSGRIIYGSGVLPETRDFYEAQMVQAPAISVNTSWLTVGHVDEVFSYVPAKTARGWKLLVASPKLAKAMLEKASADGYGATKMFVGKKWWDGTSAAISIDAALADVDLMQWSQQAQTEIDSMLEKLRTAVGLADDEIIEVPFLFEEDMEGGLVAFNPGTVNMLPIGNVAAIADPFGPVIFGEDLFRKDLRDRLGTPVNQLASDGEGLLINFVDDWDLYHALLGEVHCATNVDGPPPANVKWWEVGR